MLIKYTMTFRLYYFSWKMFSTSWWRRPKRCKACNKPGQHGNGDHGGAASVFSATAAADSLLVFMGAVWLIIKSLWIHRLAATLVFLWAGESSVWRFVVLSGGRGGGVIHSCATKSFSGTDRASEQRTKPTWGREAERSFPVAVRLQQHWSSVRLQSPTMSNGVLWVGGEG